MKQINQIGKGCLFGMLALAGCHSVEAKEKMNVLFILVDDLRPELSCYGQTEIISPNIDKLASEGTLFQRAYCNVPVSGASRGSLLTGMRPTREQFFRFDTWVKEDAPAAIVMPQMFKQNGYITISASKVFHHPTDKKEAWYECWHPQGRGSWKNYISEDNLAADKINQGNFFEMLDVPDNTYFDGKTAEKAVKDLKFLKEQGQPFFLAVGILKPHLPFTAPKKYWDLYDGDDIQLPKNYRPLNPSIPQKAFHTFGELRSYSDIPDVGEVPDDTAKKLIHGYRACVSYADAQIGKVLDALKELELDKNTVIVLIGDHGWSLGEHGLWCKHSSFNTSLNAPMIIVAPGMKKGQKVDNIVEFIDIYPTLCDLTNLDQPEQLDGETLLPLLKGKKGRKKNYAVCKWGLGTTYIHDTYFYTEWRTKEGDEYEERMLFDHSSDCDENFNIAEKADNLPLVQKLSGDLKDKRGRNY